MSPDGRYVAITSEQADGARKVALLEVGTGRSRLLDADPWEQSAGRFAPDGKTLIYARNVDGRRGLMAYDLANGVARPVVDAAGVSGEASETQTSVSPDGRSLLFSHQASNAPFDYWIADLASGKATQLTQLSLASIAPARLPAARIVHYASADGTVISALLWTPFNLARDHAAPAIVLPHGGPTGQTLDTFDRTAVALASRGYMVIAPNPRGSTGYGRAFEEANRKDLGGGDLEDEVAGAKFMVDTGYVDPRRLGITGGSYGGYMTLMAAAKTPDLWAAAVEEYGIIDWFAMYASEAPTLQQYQKGLIGDPVTDKAVYQAASPLTYVHALRAPLLVLQGDNDIRVPKGQALEVIGLLKADGRTVDSHFYPNEGHGFVKRENQIDALERTVAWFDTYLKGPRS
jgi:dipeptidyl aminopeptidase/acylaminoacyl peptidase